MYEPDAVAEYVGFTAPLIGDPLRYHWLPVPLLDDSVTVPPWQNVVAEPAVIVGVAGVGLTVTLIVFEAVLVQPFEVTVAV